MKIMSKCNVFVISLFTLGLLGCASTKDNMVATGFPVQYAEGFDDGCHSGYKAAGSLFDEFKKDISRFNSDKSMLKVGLMDSDSVRVNRKQLSVKPE